LLAAAQDNPSSLIFGLPANSLYLFLLPILATLLGPFQLLIVILAWEGRHGSLLWRIYLTILTCGILGFLAWLGALIS
jgi:hypothetical protein